MISLSVLVLVISSAKPLPSLVELGNSERGHEVGCGVMPAVLSPADLRDLSASGSAEEKQLVWSVLRANQLTRRAIAKDPNIAESCEDVVGIFQRASQRSDGEASRVYHVQTRQRSSFNESILRGMQ